MTNHYHPALSLLWVMKPHRYLFWGTGSSTSLFMENAFASTPYTFQAWDRPVSSPFANTCDTSDVSSMQNPTTHLSHFPTSSSTHALTKKLTSCATTLHHPQRQSTSMNPIPFPSLIKPPTAQQYAKERTSATLPSNSSPSQKLTTSPKRNTLPFQRKYKSNDSSRTLPFPPQRHLAPSAMMSLAQVTLSYPHSQPAKYPPAWPLPYLKACIYASRNAAVCP